MNKRFWILDIVLLFCSAMFGQLVNQQLVLEYEPDSCIWHLNIEQVSEKEFAKAYKDSTPYNGQINSISDTRLDNELVECAVKTYKTYLAGGYFTDESIKDDFENIYSYSLKQKDSDTLYAVQFTDPTSSFSFFLYHSNDGWGCDSLVVETEKIAFSNDGILAGAQGFDCDNYALIHFYKLVDTPSGKRMRRIVSYSNLETKDANNLDATWIVETGDNAQMFWVGAPNTLYVKGYTGIRTKPVFFKITLYKSKPDNPKITEEFP